MASQMLATKPLFLPTPQAGAQAHSAPEQSPRSPQHPAPHPASPTPRRTPLANRSANSLAHSEPSDEDQQLYARFKKETGLTAFRRVALRVLCQEGSDCMQTMFQPLVTKKWISLQDFLAWRWDADAPLLYSSKWGELADGGCGKGGCLPFREIRHRSLIKWDLGFPKAVEMLKKALKVVTSPFFLLVFTDHPVFPPWLLNSHKVLLIFTANKELRHKHPKLVGIPLGLESYYSHEAMAQVLNASDTSGPSDLVFMRFRISPPPIRVQRRTKILQELNSGGWGHLTVNVTQRLSPYDFYSNVRRYKYTLSPPGNGVDAYRTWEVLTLGRVPVVQTILQPDLFAELPVLSIDSWTQLTESFLLSTWADMQAKQFNINRLLFTYWCAYLLKRALLA